VGRLHVCDPAGEVLDHAIGLWTGCDMHGQTVLDAPGIAERLNILNPTVQLLQLMTN